MASTGNAALDAALARIAQTTSSPPSSGSSASSSSTSSSTKSEPMVYLGSTLQNETEFVAPQFAQDGSLAGMPKRSTIGVNEEKTLSLSDAQLQWYRMSPDQQKQWAQKAYALGYITSPVNLSAAQGVWNSMVGESANYLSVGKKFTPWDVLDKNAGANVSALKQRAQGGTTQTNTSIDLSDRSSVEAISRQVLQQALGRDPTDSEVNTYFNTIRAQEKAHPTVTTTKNDGKGNTSTTSSGGFSQADAADFLQSKIQDDPEYAMYQGGTTYFNAAMQAVGAIGGA